MNQSEEKNPKRESVWDIPIGEGLRGAAELRKFLSISEKQYLSIAGPVLKDSRSYLLYIALDEVKKASIHLMRLRELFDDPDVGVESDDDAKTDDDNRLNRLLTTSILEEQQIRIRRLLELLVTLVLFSTTNEQPYYRHLLLIEDLEKNVSTNLDLEEFYGKRSANIDATIKRQIAWTRQVESEIDLNRCWYLRRRTPIKSAKKLRPGQLQSSIRSRVKEALPLMSATEMIVFGFTYNWVYGTSSEAIHYRSARDDFRLAPDENMAIVRKLTLLIPTILDRCYRLLGKPDAPRTKKMSESLERSDFSDRAWSKVTGDVEIGDFVLVQGDIAQVIDVQESQYGYRSYKVLYVSDKPQPNITEDWFPAPYIQIFYSKKRSLEMLSTRLKSGDIPREMQFVLDQLTDEELNLAMRQSIKDVWDIAIRDRIKSKSRIRINAVQQVIARDTKGAHP